MDKIIMWHLVNPNNKERIDEVVVFNDEEEYNSFLRDYQLVGKYELTLVYGKESLPPYQVSD